MNINCVSFQKKVFEWIFAANLKKRYLPTKPLWKDMRSLSRSLSLSLFGLPYFSLFERFFDFSPKITMFGFNLSNFPLKFLSSDDSLSLPFSPSHTQFTLSSLYTTKKVMLLCFTFPCRSFRQRASLTTPTFRVVNYPHLCLLHKICLF